MDVYTLYIYACRYKMLKEAGMKISEIAQRYNYNKSCVSRAIVVANTFKPNQINGTMTFSDYIEAAKTDNPLKYLNEIHEDKKTKPYSVKRPKNSKLDIKINFLERAEKAAQLRAQGYDMLGIATKLNVSTSEASILYRVGNLPSEILTGPVSTSALRLAVRKSDPVKYLKSLPPQMEYVIEQKINKQLIEANTVENKDGLNGFEKENIKAFALGILALIESEEKAKTALNLYKVVNSIIKEENEKLQEKITMLEKDNKKLQEVVHNQAKVLQKNINEMQSQIRILSDCW